MSEDRIKNMVKDNYGRKAKKEQSCCAPVETCCGGTDTNEYISQQVYMNPHPPELMLRNSL